MSRLWTVALVLMGVVPGLARPAFAQDAPPSDPCQEAERILFSAARWKDYHEYFRRFPQCDDGYLAEGASDEVVRMLAFEWRKLEDLRRIIKRDPAFQDFVLRHIDETCDRDDLNRLLRNAKEDCPRRSRRLCERMRREAEEALEESRSRA